MLLYIYVYNIKIIHIILNINYALTLMDVIIQ